ncbi:hypothetical protein I547_7190 [Mycobacterium kansasii 824]|uniref:Uncharacterized protein n=1 Tax=Mycobacterium kansasii TaxID=1768 RepID=A0A1V3WBM7_MYCKA|nr:hypothetical protein I547_7190 [Mycobacterium kansasii 824]OOK64379.1 hypothetical protein BZL29_8246 [Mycobacterium kansasii]
MAFRIDVASTGPPSVQTWSGRRSGCDECALAFVILGLS